MGSFGFSRIFFASPPPHPTLSPLGTDGDRKFWVPPIKNLEKKPWGLPFVGLLKHEKEDHRIQPLSHCRAVGAATVLPLYVLQGGPRVVMPTDAIDIYVHDPRLRQSVRSHNLAVEFTRSNLVSHARSFLPSTTQLWIFLPAAHHKLLPLDQGPAAI